MKEITQEMTTKAKEIVLNVSNLEEKIRTIKEENARLRQEWANLVCPWEIGDRVDYLSYNRMIECSGQITGIYLYRYGFSYYVTIGIFRKNGVVGKREKTVYDTRHLRLKEEK